MEVTALRTRSALSLPPLLPLHTSTWANAQIPYFGLERQRAPTHLPIGAASVARRDRDTALSLPERREAVIWPPFERASAVQIASQYGIGIGGRTSNCSVNSL